MRVLVQFSGGKDSHACLIWAVKKFKSKNVEAVFCNTKWESELTYIHIKEVAKRLKVKLTILTSSVYNGMEDLIYKKKQTPSLQRRFCTEELKIKPFLHYLLKVKEDVLIIQGIRSSESVRRSKMKKECRYFKYYLEPYKKNKQGNNVYYNYLKKDVLKFVSKYDDSLLRPIFDWSDKQVISYIIENNHKPNPLYKMGFKRVGCFPCISTSHTEIKQINKLFPSRIKKIIELETKNNLTFFSTNSIPKRFCSIRTIIKTGKNKGKIFRKPSAKDVIKYLNEKNSTINMFDRDNNETCVSYYNLCE